MTRCGVGVRRTSALLLLSLLATALCAGCLNAGPEVQSVKASAGAASDGPAETSKESTSGAGDVPEATTVRASQIEGDLAGLLTPPPGSLSSRRRRRASVPATMPTQCSRYATRSTR